MKGVRAAALGLALTVGGAAAGHAQDILSLTIIDYGIYKYRRDTRPNPDMQVTPVPSICHVATTHRVSTEDGVQFGFRFQVKGPTRGALVNLQQTISWPDATKQTNRPTRIGATGYIGWTNRHSRPGIWTLQLAADDRTLASIAFSLVDGIGIEGELDRDSACFLLSSL